MDTAKTFDAYAVIGVIIPGSVIALMLALHWPEFAQFLGADGLSVGGFGLFIFAAFVLGHLVQAGGNILEYLIWAPTGMPTQWVRKGPGKFLTADQQTKLQERVVQIEPAVTSLTALTRTDWGRVVSRIYSSVHAASRSQRIDVFNRNYGLFRGLATAFLVSGVWLAFFTDASAVESALPFILSLLAAFRMWRCARQYARALFVSFIDLPST